VLVTPDEDGRRPPRHEILNVLHNGTNPAEIARVRRDHPGEPDSVMNGRVLGTIAPFRCTSPVPSIHPSPFRALIPSGHNEPVLFIYLF
jgi:pyruvate dehydrogenase phosphatase